MDVVDDLRVEILELFQVLQVLTLCHVNDRQNVLATPIQGCRQAGSSQAEETTGASFCNCDPEQHAESNAVASCKHVLVCVFLVHCGVVDHHGLLVEVPSDFRTTLQGLKDDCASLGITPRPMARDALDVLTFFQREVSPRLLLHLKKSGTHMTQGSCTGGALTIKIKLITDRNWLCYIYGPNGRLIRAFVLSHAMTACDLQKPSYFGLCVSALSHQPPPLAHKGPTR
eukprot:3568221-Amphidinium_carterae.2